MGETVMLRKVLNDGKYLKLSDNSVWPNPGSDKIVMIEWQLRYGSPLKVRFEAAEILAAYMALCKHPRRVADVRRAMKQAEVLERADD